MNNLNKLALIFIFAYTSASFSMYSSLVRKMMGTANKNVSFVGIKKTFVLSKKSGSAVQDVKNKLLQKQIEARDAKHFAESFEYPDNKYQKPNLADRLDKMASRTLILGIIYILIGR